MRISKEEEEPKTVVVGVKMDAESRELLTWALVKVAKAGDRVVALHVIPSSSGLIDLKLKLCRGSSTRKILVRETMSYEANNLILGIKKNCRGIRSSPTSIAKYCSKKLPKDCSVLAVSNGKIVFQRESTENRNCSRNLSRKRSNHDYIFNSPRASFTCLPVVSKPRLTYPSSMDHHDSRDFEEARDQNCAKSRRDDSLALVPVNKPGSPSKSIRSLLVRELQESKPGWPLLRKAVLTDKKTSEKPKMSVVQWAMRLPSRYSASSVIHSDSNHHTSDGEEQSIVPTGRTDSSCCSLATSDDEKEFPEELRSLQEKYSSVCRLFTYKELQHATSNFSSENLIGRGGSSIVYKGCLSDGKELAVKLLKPSEDVLKEFVSEIEIITALHHKNMISLFGFCFENDNLVLVYDFLSRGSLEEILHGKREHVDALRWVQRYKVAMGVAEALDYLHSGGNAQPVIHRDVKSSNILLSDDFDPQLADFGLALWASSASSPLTCNDVAGTFGYLAPEYFMYGKVNEKIDVYAFGVVLLELLSGRKPVNSQCPKGEESLVLWAKKILQDGKMKQLVDPSLGDKYDEDEMERMILSASICIRQDPRSRPRISLVVKLLRGDADVLKWARAQVNNSTEDSIALDETAANQNSNIQSHINLALLDVEDDTLSVNSDFVTANTSLEDYLKGRWSRTSSFD
ncbi:uncharacterized protein A4U43_C09F2320 [Asparagus officinalis]|uniref:Protein kinase domain-containing protein n=1 Tax=Asparagus officinalis TaxID=4686 RepID=A0A5P1E7Z8_ASPOF|nr:uncharacterized protein A4U43_C09F2320 [Asparagus officinalis]